MQKLIDQQTLTLQEAVDCMEKILNRTWTDAQIGAFLAALAAKGEKREEILGMLHVMRENMVRVYVSENVVDICGTGGDGIGSFNTSTAAALVASAAGAKVAKCGNRSSSSSCGSADLLEAAGVRIELTPDEVGRWLSECGFAFLFTPQFHPALRNLAPLRRELGIRTALNLLGPLGNPVRPRRQLLGVSHRELAPLYAEILLQSGTEHAMVVHGLDGMDEISLSAPTEVYEIRAGALTTSLIEPESLGLSYAAHDDIKGGDASYNRDMLAALFGGERGPVRDIVCLNAGAALVISGIAVDLKEGLHIAADTIDSGAAKSKLAELVNRSGRTPKGEKRDVYAR
ncbi:anthranilate phosphoribosyltransferase [Xylanibacillus composti]|nr:anthranilate phosphoribosyltransferase [Xylanibacillus composti]